MEKENQQNYLEHYLNALNNWSDKNLNNEPLKEKIFLTKVLCHLFITSENKEVYNDILSILFPNKEITDEDILIFLESFRGELIDNNYLVFFKISDIEESLIFTFDISKLIDNGNKTIN